MKQRRNERSDNKVKREKKEGQLKGEQEEKNSWRKEGKDSIVGESGETQEGERNGKGSGRDNGRIRQWEEGKKKEKDRKHSGRN